ncbi:MAG: alpha/beta hydrolase [Anaeromyxobacter sp.]
MTGARRYVDLGGPVHYADHGGAGRPIVLVHGLGGSLDNWAAVAPALRAHGRVLALDLAGHGRTPSHGRTARMGANRRLLSRFLREVAGAPAVLVGNSMGGTLSLVEAAAEPERVAGLVLVNAALPLAGLARVDRTVALLFTAFALPAVGEALLRLRALRGPERSVHDLLRLCGIEPHGLPREVLDAHVALAAERAALGRRAHRDFLAAQRSLMNRLLRRGRFFRMVATVRAPVLVLQGERDRLVSVAAARALAAARPDWPLRILPGLGHAPQLEAPEQFLRAVEPWLERSGAG